MVNLNTKCQLYGNLTIFMELRQENLIYKYFSIMLERVNNKYINASTIKKCRYRYKQTRAHTQAARAHL